MKLLLVIDHLGMGGAQRQMVELACGLRDRGHEVEIFVYFPQYDFLRPQLVERNVIVHEYRKGHGFSLGVLLRLISLLRGGKFDAVVSYLSSANIYSELAVLLAGGPKLVVSERTSHQDDKAWLSASLRRLMHGLADKVVANSMAHQLWLQGRPLLRRKTVCIYNGIDLQHFRPRARIAPEASGLLLLGVGRVSPEKNLLNLISALALLQAEGITPRISWAGAGESTRPGAAYWQSVNAALAAAPAVKARWVWLGRRDDIAALMQQHDALVHPSLYEGLPNAVCEALASGLPVLASSVCDHPLLVADGQRGFLFDPQSPMQIAAAIRTLNALGAQDRAELSGHARLYAESRLGIERMVSEYEALLVRLSGARPAQVPAR